MRIHFSVVLFGLVGTFWGQIDTRISPAPVPAEQTTPDVSSKWTGARLTGFLAEELGPTFEQGVEATLAIEESETNQLPSFNHYGSSQFTGTLSFHKDWSRASVLTQYAGGADIYTSSSTHYHQFSAAQAFKWSRWNFSLNQEFNYLPQSSFGFNPSLGIGNGLLPFANNGMPEGPALLLPEKVSERMVSTQASAEYVVGARSSLTFSGNFSDLHFSGVTQGTPLVDSQMLGSGAQYTYSLNASAAIGAAYNFLQGRSLGLNSLLQAHSITGTFSRKFGKRLALQAAAGPQFITLNEFGTTATLTSATVTVTTNYQLGRTTVGVSDFQGVNPGSGLFLGSRVNDVRVSVDRQFSATLQASLSAGYAQNDNIGIISINVPQHYSSIYVAARVEKDISRMFSGFAVYSIQHQDTGGLLCNTSGCPTSAMAQTGIIGLRFQIHPLTLQP